MVTVKHSPSTPLYYIIFVLYNMYMYISMSLSLEPIVLISKIVVVNKPFSSAS